MKKSYLYSIPILLLCCINTQHLYSQQQSNNNKIYKIWISPKGDDPIITGYLKVISDSLTIIKSLYLLDEEIIHINDIKQIKVRRQGKPELGVLLGAVSGIVGGYIVGYMDGDDFCAPGSLCFFTRTANEKGLIGALLGGVSAAIIGELIGSEKITIPLRNDTHLLKKELEKYVLPDE